MSGPKWDMTEWLLLSVIAAVATFSFVTWMVR